MIFLTLITAASIFLPQVPGAISTAVTQDNIATTICVSGYTATIRPPSSYTTSLKTKQMKAFGLTGKPGDYEEDHLISLEIGGNPTDPNNLWPEPYDGSTGADKKDQLENKLHKLVCNKTITLKEAQSAIATNWISNYDKYMNKPK